MSSRSDEANDASRDPLSLRGASPSWRHISMRKVILNGREISLAELCREMNIDRRTVESRLAQGMNLQQAIRKPPRKYPKTTRRPRSISAEPISDPLIEDAIDLMIDLREVLISISPTPRRERILAGVRLWLRQAGWRG